MKICVQGMWHLGCTFAASLASQEDFQVVGLDANAAVIENLNSGKAPLFEPGLDELIREDITAGRLSFTTDYAEALSGAEIWWVAYDTPVDEEDRADVDFVKRELDAAFPFVESGTIILISSQLPVGSVDELRWHWQELDPAKKLVYAYSPENLRLGNALKTFRAEDRFVLGIDGEEGREKLVSMLKRFSPRVEVMSVKSAEMTKHALNAFLATSVAMINELARICEEVGADAKEVERGLKSEMRIGPKAYLGPGGPFAGGTLARDLRFLVQLGQQYKVDTPLFNGVLNSNETHKDWVQHAATRLLKGIETEPARVAILGITYKPGTDTLRRSEAVHLGLWLAEQGCEVIFHDPVTRELPADLSQKFRLTNDLSEVLQGADLLIVATGWPVYREELNPAKLAQHMRRVAVIDQNRFLAAQLERAKNLIYLAVGKPIS